MADQEIISEEVQDETEPKKKSGKKKFLIIFVLLLLIGGGGTFGFYRWRRWTANKAQTAKETQAKKSAEPKNGEGGKEDDTEVKEVLELQPFIVNLADKGENRYLRMTVSLGIGEGNEEKADPLFTTRIRNAILAVITSRTSDDVLTAEGKAQLRRDMLAAARAVADKPEVHAIYITDFIVQM